MLIGISPFISPDLLKTLSMMGHGDEIILADAHFPSESLGPPCLRADGLMINDLLNGILPLFALDEFVDKPVAMMSPVEGDTENPEIEKGYSSIINNHSAKKVSIDKMDRFDFYDRSRSAFAIVATSDCEKYANIILKKGVTPL
ncbi:MAG: L-fucose mutarotase [Verrucomicrobiales bacterium]|nr:L-fucose mutarotase [Verrucomicrobiales bacterium]|tara:strand:- start:5912 stop:6343 length:432 start_codon:yes stop_codon:yes gene_type:complete